MILWIPIYSQFETANFIDEVTILYGSINLKRYPNSSSIWSGFTINTPIRSPSFKITWLFLPTSFPLMNVPLPLVSVSTKSGLVDPEFNLGDIVKCWRDILTSSSLGNYLTISMIKECSLTFSNNALLAIKGSEDARPLSSDISAFD